MKVKGNLKKVRGWFPQEPRLIGICSKVTNVEVKQQPTVIPSGYDLSATKAFGAEAIFYGLLSFPFIIPYLYFFHTPSNLFWIFAGLATGIFSGILVSKNQLNRFAENCIVSVNLKDLKLAIASLVPAILISVIFYAFTGAYGGTLFLPFAILSSVYASRFFLMWTFEKRENMRIMQSWWSTNYILIPKAPKSNE